MKDVEGWSSSPLGQLLISKNDKSKQVKSTEYAPIGSYPVVDQSSEFICGYHDDKTKLIETNLPLTVFGDHTRHTKFISFPFICGADGTQLLKPKNGFEDKFFFYLVAWAAGKIGNYGYDRHFKHLKEFECDYPDDPTEQTKIAEIFSTVDRAIEQTEALIAKQQRIKTGLMQDLLTRGIDEHGNLRSEQTHKFKDSPLGRIPVEWEVKRLGKLLANINQGWSPDCNSEPALIGEWGVIKTTSVEWQGYSDYENKALPERLKPRYSLEIISGDLLMTRAGPNSRVGVIAYVYHTRDKLMLSDKIYRLIPAENMDGRFLCYALSGFETQKHLSNYKTGMAESQTNISQEIVKNLLTVVPNKGAQARIADRLDQMSTVTKRSVETLEKLRSLKTALMQDLLTGKKHVTTMLSDTEVASL
jgi:type I restriction enzyme S subunit